ncbi:alpha-N-arabinofuranosidase [Roseateles sp.]|uniref:alpha-N-arabinofuranosidase n=1 Tax=Roseateles sp. TaxID=1971397 RepID=UPI003928E885
MALKWKSIRTLACVLSASAALGSTALAADAPRVQLTVATDAPGPEISRHLFGQFAEHLGTGIYGGIWVGKDSKIPNTRGIRKDVVEALRAIKVPNIRWPGGCYADKYHWRDGIGPQARRPKTLNPDWGGVIEPNSFGTHEFMDLAEQVGAEAYVSINVGSGSVREMAEWLEYMTSAKPSSLAQERVRNGAAKPFKVPLLGIGNEVWGCGGSMTPEEYAAEMKKYASFAVNFHPDQQKEGQKMRRIASGPNRDDYRFTEVVMRHVKEHALYSWGIEGLSLHSYTGLDKWPPSHPATDFAESEYMAILKATLDMETFVTKHSAIMDRYDPEKKVALVVDEWGAWYAPTAGSNPSFLQQQNSQRDAILAALNINLFARHADRVRIANIAQMINVLQAMILTSDTGIVLTPSYHAFKLYVPFQDAKLLKSQHDGQPFKLADTELPRFDSVAARGRDGKVWVALTNVHPTEPLTLQLKAGTATAARGETLTAPRFDSVNTFKQPQLVAPKPITARQDAACGCLVLDLAPASLTVVSLD